MSSIKIIQSKDINKIITLYDNLRSEGYSCGIYGSVFDFYIANSLGIKLRSDEFHNITSLWTSFLWNSDKNNILTTLNDFINRSK